MTDHVFPGQHTTTTVITSNTQVTTDFRFDTEYLTTLYGKLKLAQIVASLLGIFMVSFSGDFVLYGKNSFYALIAGIAFWWSLILLFLYLFHAIEKFYRIPWLQIELIVCCILAAFFLLASVLILQYIAQSILFIFQILVGLIATAAYGYDAYIKLLAIQRGEIAQGNRTINKQVTEITSPPRY